MRVTIVTIAIILLLSGPALLAILALKRTVLQRGAALAGDAAIADIR